MRDINHFIGGASAVGTSGSFADVFDPNTGQVQARVLQGPRLAGRARPAPNQRHRASRRRARAR